MSKYLVEAHTDGGLISCTCDTYDEAMEELEEMRSCGYTPQVIQL